jgi:hypothetical protein
VHPAQLREKLNRGLLDKLVLGISVGHGLASEKKFCDRHDVLPDSVPAIRMIRKEFRRAQRSILVNSGKVSLES